MFVPSICESVMLAIRLKLEKEPNVHGNMKENNIHLREYDENDFVENINVVENVPLDEQV